MSAEEFRTGDPLCTIGPKLTVLSWNRGAEQLTGISTAEALGRPCWELLGGVGEAGDLICHLGCSSARLAREGFPVSGRRMFVRTAQGPVQVSAATVALGDGRILHLLTRTAPGRDRRALELTRRQHDVLDLMAQGLQAKAIAERLGVTSTTVRTHIRAILRELGAHSQLEALAKARTQGFDI